MEQIRQEISQAKRLPVLFRLFIQTMQMNTLIIFFWNGFMKQWKAECMNPTP